MPVMPGPKTPMPPPSDPHRTADGHRLVHAVTRHTEHGPPVVLVVDDDVQIRSLVTRMVHALDSRIVVEQAADGKAALTRLSEIRLRLHHDPTLIILDLKMPVLDGWDVIAALKKEYEAQGKAQGIPIIVLSATSGEKGLFLQHSVHNGRSGYLPLVTVAKDSCAEPHKYYAQGAAGLMGWVKHFLGMA